MLTIHRAIAFKQDIPQKIGIIGDALAPNFNEAFANQVYLLSQALGAPVLTGNNLGLAPLRKIGQYLIVNARFLREKTHIHALSLINGAFFYSFVKLFERQFDIIFLTGGINSGFLAHVNLSKCILILNSMPFSASDEEAKVFMGRFAPRLRGIIAQSQRIKDKLVNLGVERQKVHVVYPWIDLHRFRYSEPPSSEEFRIVFASAPNLEDSQGNIFEAKGISLLLEAFKEFARLRKASLYLLWRGYYNRALVEQIKGLDLESQVKVINEVADMPKLYVQSHITVIPFLNAQWSPEIPLSAVESLACGRPVVTTNVVELAEVVQKYKCGCVVDPIKEKLVAGLVECQTNYGVYQKNCRHVAEKLFSLDLENLRGALINY